MDQQHAAAAADPQQDGRNISASACFLPDGTTPWCVEDWLESARQQQSVGTLHSVDELAAAARGGASSRVVRQIAKAMGTEQHLKLHVGKSLSDMFESTLDKGLGGGGPLDMCWLDFGSGEELPDITARLWRRLRPGGLLLVRSTLTNAYGRLWLRSLREGAGLGTVSRFGLKGDFELLSLFEPHKRLQNSVTVLRKLGDEPPIYSWAA
jgi:hypothetical protein